MGKLKNNAGNASVLTRFTEHIEPISSGQGKDSRQCNKLEKVLQDSALKLAKVLKREAGSDAIKGTLLSTSSVKITTQTAQVLASELNVPLYKVELSQVASKYIGETEKNLSVLFSDAEKQGAILFFDEADALFGKRSEVKDGHDRYANIEPAYLLQRLESYSGLTILASPSEKLFDPQLIARLGKVFKFPD